MAQSTIYKKIGQLRHKIDGIKKDSKNPFFKSSYADINSIEKLVEPVEFEVGLTHTISSSVSDDGKQRLTLTVADVDTGETLESTLEIIIGKNDMQQLIAGHTYGRRGLLVSFYSLEAEDDDGNGSSLGKQQDDVKSVDLEPMLIKISESMDNDSLATVAKEIKSAKLPANAKTKLRQAWAEQKATLVAVEKAEA